MPVKKERGSKPNSQPLAKSTQAKSQHIAPIDDDESGVEGVVVPKALLPDFMPDVFKKKYQDPPNMLAKPVIKVMSFPSNASKHPSFSTH